MHKCTNAQMRNAQMHKCTNTKCKMHKYISHAPAPAPAHAHVCQMSNGHSQLVDLILPCSSACPFCLCSNSTDATQQATRGEPMFLRNETRRVLKRNMVQSLVGRVEELEAIDNDLRENAAHRWYHNRINGALAFHCMMHQARTVQYSAVQ